MGADACAFGEKHDGVHAGVRQQRTEVPASWRWASAVQLRCVFPRKASLWINNEYGTVTARNDGRLAVAPSHSTDDQNNSPTTFVPGAQLIKSLLITAVTEIIWAVLPKCF